ncbi:MAG: hypothetical protein J6V35_04180 [Bacteroidales bacterium]|nr:hypothetical protein [Bacteroidales bacterium]
MSELEKYKLMLFMTVRNSAVLPKGMELGKTEEEISRMTRDTLKAMEKMIDFEGAKKLYELGGETNDI